MNILICCSASKDISNEYVEDVRIFLNKLMKQNNLVFGGCYSGLMADAYDITKKYGNKVIGVNPERYKDDFKDLNCDVEIVVDDLNDRVNSLVNNSDALVFLPGGIGTMSELFSAIECKRCHEFDKPIVLYNSCGFYDKFIDLMENIYVNKFAKESDKQFYFVSNNTEDIIEYINNYE